MEITRKQFLNDWMRYILIAVIAVISGIAFFKNGHHGTTNCPPGNVCQGCSKAGSCNERKGSD